MNQSNLSDTVSNLEQLKWKSAYKCILVGLLSGLLVSVYRLGIEFGTEKALEAYALLRVRPVYLLPWLFFMAIVSYLTYRLIKLEPCATGSGIPQVEGVVLFGMKMKWHTILLVRFLGGFLTSLFGVSVGREGPSIQIGAAGGQALAGKLSKNKLEANYLITAGASAGLSAAFNAPLSGIVFALEEVHRTFSPNLLIAATTAALTADMVSKYFFGLSPVLNYVDVQQLPIRFYILLLPLGVVSGIVGAVTGKGLLGFGTLYKKMPAPLRPAAALLFALPCGLFMPQVLGGGQGLIQLSETVGAGITTLAVYLAVKLLFTCVSFGSGIPGGIFMPILSIGALTGCILGQFAVSLGLPPECVPAFCVCAMAGAMSGSVKAPVTSILLMAEMTGSLIHLLPVAAVSFIALLTSDLMKVAPIYEALLARITGESTASERRRKTGAVVEIPVELGSEAAGKKVRDISWPEGALIVGLSRGRKELVPNGETQILQGDYLVVLSSEQGYEAIHRQLRALCHAR